MNQFTASLWGDEAWAATLAVKSYTDIIGIVSHDTSPPLYYLLLHTWMHFFGTSEPAIRSLSFLFFILTIFAVYLIGNHLWNKRTGLIAALMIFLNPLLFHYAFEGRMYALLVAASTLSTYFFISKRRWLFIITATAALYTHHFSLFLISFFALWRLKEIKKLSPPQFLKTYGDFLIIGLLYLPWLFPLYRQTKMVAGGFWLGRPTVFSLLETGKKFLVGYGDGGFYWLAMAVGVIILLSRRWREKASTSLFLLGWFLWPLLATFFISQKFQPIFYDRYLLLSIPALILLLASQWRRLPFSGEKVLASVFIIIMFSLNYHYFLNPTKRPFHQMADFIRNEAPTLTLINYNGAAHHLWESKYYGLRAPIYSPTPLPFYTGTALMEEGDVVTVLPDVPLLGIITSEPVEKINLPGYHQRYFRQFGDLKIVWMERKSKI